MKKLLIIIAIAVLAGAGWFFLSPLFIDEAVDEDLPGFATLPTRAEVDAMSDADRSRLAAAMDEFSRSAPDSSAAEPMPEAPRRLAAGSFVDADAVHKGSGTAAVYELVDGSRVLRFEDFRVTNGPALVVLLSKAESPATADAVIDAGFVSLGKLKGNVGNQNYTIPADLDLAQYRSAVIWCELFDVLFSQAALIPNSFDAPAAAEPAGENGDIRFEDDGSSLAWSDVRQAWVEPEEFFIAYAESRGGLTWGRGSDYPPYAEVSERDLFLVELDSGVCLMEFWHERWRRANDVRRWNDAFNAYGGCPHVFE
ncbi:MAG: DM13 domain-containing protein [Pseudomonadota bacterium]